MDLRRHAAYETLEPHSNGFTGKVVVKGPDSAKFSVTDSWSVQNGVIGLRRTVKVHGSSSQGFMSGFQFDLNTPHAWTEAEWFAPGMIYGGFDHLTPTAIGGKACYKPGNYTVRIREDRLPAPLFLAHFSDDRWVALLNPAPHGDTNARDALDVHGETLTSEAFQFGALGGQERDGKLSLGYWFPGSEGEVTYKGNAYPGGQLHQSRRRYHPVTDGFTQRYEVRFRFWEREAFVQSIRTAWRWAWQELSRQTVRHDIDAARRALINLLASNVVENESHTGIPMFFQTVNGKVGQRRPVAVLGFCGKNFEAANYLLQEAAKEEGERSETLRSKAEAIIASFTRLKMSPPEGEGFRLEDGAPVRGMQNELN